MSRASVAVFAVLAAFALAVVLAPPDLGRALRFGERLVILFAATIFAAIAIFFGLARRARTDDRHEREGPGE